MISIKKIHNTDLMCSLLHLYYNCIKAHDYEHVYRSDVILSFVRMYKYIYLYIYVYFVLEWIYSWSVLRRIQHYMKTMNLMIPSCFISWKNSSVILFTKYDQGRVLDFDCQGVCVTLKIKRGSSWTTQDTEMDDPFLQ